MERDRALYKVDDTAEDIFRLQRLVKGSLLTGSDLELDAFFGDLKSAIIIVDNDFKILYLNNTAQTLNLNIDAVKGSMVIDFAKQLLQNDALLTFYEALLNRRGIAINDGFSLVRIEKCVLNPIGNDGFVIKILLDELYTVSAANLFRYFPGMPIGYFGFDLLGARGISIRFVSDNFSSLFPGMEMNATMNDPLYFAQFMHPDDHGEFLARLRSLKKGKNTFSFEFRMIEHADDEGRWFRMISSRFSEKTEKNFWLAYIEDIDPEKQATREKEILVHETLDDERHRMSMELHDGLGQNLVALNLYLSSLSPDVNGDLVQSCRQLTTDSIRLMKSMCYNLAPPDLDKGLMYALDVFFGKSNEHSSSINYRFEGKEIPMKQLSTDRAYHIFRIVQEFVTNAQKYAECSEVVCEVGLRNNQPVIIIHDNGKGFDRNKINGGFGLKNMEKRALLAGAKMELSSSIGEGTLLVLEF
jgi:signal transduction histidine kinase